MEVIDSKNLDHHGLVAGIIADLDLKELINTRLSKESDAKISDGEALSAMILNSLGFTSRPLSLTPQFFASKAIDSLFGEGVRAADFNRHRLGRCLDKIYDYGCDELFAELAQHICSHEEINKEFVSLDTTSFKVSGEYDTDTDENEIKITHGFSKDHRPDLKQVILELLVSQDGGVPLISKSFDGNASDSKIFKARCEALVKQFKASDAPEYLVADSKLYDKNNAEYLSSLSFITRIPRILKEEQLAVTQALSKDSWVFLDDENKYHTHRCKHYGMEQRWMIIYSKAAHARRKKTLKKQVEKEEKNLKISLKHLRNEKFNCEVEALAALNRLNDRLKLHRLVDFSIEHPYPESVCSNMIV